jgi:hypothetical protein
MSDRRRSPESPDLIARLDAAKQRLDRSVDDLSRILDWRDEIRSRIWRAQHTFLYADCEIDFSDLQTEAETFGRVCRCLGWRTSK